MGFIAWIVVGAIAGFLASQIMHAREGLLMMVVLGVVGGLVGGFVATSVLKIGSVDGINLRARRLFVLRICVRNNGGDGRPLGTRRPAEPWLQATPKMLPTILADNHGGTR